MNREEAIRKIKKMMAIASDPTASDQEIQLATYRANKLRIQYKLEDKDLFNKSTTAEDVISIPLKYRGSGYIHWVLRALVEHYQCQTSYRGMINRNHVEFYIIGLKEDVEFCKPIAEGLVYYLTHLLQDLKECYIGSDDFRIYKRMYLSGFADGLCNQLNQLRLEMHLEQKFEIAVLDVPVIVKDFVKNNVRQTTSNFVIGEGNDGYFLGQKHGREYELDRKDLIEGV